MYPLTHAEMQWMTPSGMGQGGRDGFNQAWTHQFMDKETEETRRLDRATMCSVSSKPLCAPIVITDLGHLCNKEDLLEALLSKKLPAHLDDHVKSMRDFAPAILHANPHAESGEGLKGGADSATLEVPFCCPLAHIPFNGRLPFVYLRCSGHVISERAFKHIGGKACPISDVPCPPEDVMPLYPTEEQYKELLAQAATRKVAAREKKKRQQKVVGQTVAATKEPLATATAAASGSSSSTATATATAAQSTAKGCGRASTAARAAPAVSSKAAISGKERAAPTAADGTAKRKREYEKVIHDKAASSDVYKSLFLTPAQKKAILDTQNNDYCARGVPALLARP